MMNPKQHKAFIEEMKLHTAEVIRATVNGKIDDLKRTSLTKEDFAKYVEGDMTWKEEAQPALDNMRNLTGVWKTIISISLGIVAIGAGIAAFKKLFSL